MGSSTDVLGESPVWDHRGDAIYWIDAACGAVQRTGRDGAGFRKWSVKQRIGSLGLRRAGGAIVALMDGLYVLDFDTGALTLAADVERANLRTQFNDGKVDPFGNFVFGSMRRGDGDDGIGCMYRIDAGHRVVKLDGGFTVFNGPCFSVDGSVIYFADTMSKLIWSADYDPSQGIENKRVFADLRGADLMPDGATVDADGCVWSAFVLSGEIGRFAPSGEFMLRLPVPVKRPTSLAFGGKDMDILFLTSSGSAPAGDPEAGGLFAIRGLGVRGIPTAFFAG